MPSVPSPKSLEFRCVQNGPPARREEGAYLNGYVTDEQRGRRAIFNATLWAASSWLFFCVARSARPAPFIKRRRRGPRIAWGFAALHPMLFSSRAFGAQERGFLEVKQLRKSDRSAHPRLRCKRTPFEWRKGEINQQPLRDNIAYFRRKPLDVWHSVWAMRFSLHQKGSNGFLHRTHLSLDQCQ
jgi:hypothetical protein